MVDLDWKTKMVSSDIPKSPKPTTTTNNKVHPSLRLSIPTPKQATLSSSSSSNSNGLSPASHHACSSYDHYLRLADLHKLHNSTDFPSWSNEPIVKPALHALELTFRFISTVLSDPRPYSNQPQWKRRLESLAASQIGIIAEICEDEEDDAKTVPFVDLSLSQNGVVAREGSSAEVWKVAGESVTVVSKTSQESLLPRLATWHKSEDIAEKIMYSIECQFRRCPYTLGIGEPNLAGKPSLDYDSVCKPSELRRLSKENMNENDRINDNYENKFVYTTHQILETWVHVCRKLLDRIVDQIEEKKHDKASRNCFLVERVWRLLEEIEGLHLIMDPADFLRLKNQLLINSEPREKALCFWSKGIVEIARMSKELRNKVPAVLDVEVDPTGGPRIQEAAMRLYGCERASEGEFGKVFVLQGLQAIEAAMKRFFYAYKQVLVVVMGSLEANGGNVGCDSLSQVFLEPTYFPSLDAAKTFLGDYYGHEQRKN